MTPTKLLEPPIADLGPPPPPPRKRFGGDDGDGGEPRPSRSRPQLAVFGMWLALVPVAMLFLAFGSAYVVRKGLGSSWQSVPLPDVLWVNTVLLLCSSVVLERGRALLRAGGSARAWFAATLVLGVLFVVGQFVAWNEYRDQGIRINATPHTSFFYLLTATHAVHLAGGLVALVAATVWPQRRAASHPTVAAVTAIYWHFLGLLWVALFALLSLWR